MNPGFKIVTKGTIAGIMLVLAGCAAYGPPPDSVNGNYYDQYGPDYSGYPGQSGYYSYPYQPGYYGYPYPGIVGPSLYFGAGRWGGSAGGGFGATFGF